MEEKSKMEEERDKKEETNQGGESSYGSWIFLKL
jgi:hypothetical protein